MLLYQGGVSCYCISFGGSWGLQTRKGVTHQGFHTNSMSPGDPSLLVAPSWCLLISALAQSPKRSIYRMSHLIGEHQRGEEHPQDCTLKTPSLDLGSWQCVLSIHVPTHSAVLPLPLKRPWTRWSWQDWCGVPISL